MTDVVCQRQFWQPSGSRKKIHYRIWQPPVDANALLVLLHGFAEHTGRYEKLGCALAQQGIAVAAADLPGHGLSSGNRGDIGSLEACLEILEKLTRLVFMPACRQESFSLFGHSFGGLLGINWMMKNPPLLKRVVIQSPLLEAGFPIPEWKKTAAKILSILWPTCALSVNLEVSWLSRDAAVGETYQKDPLVFNKMSARTYQDILTTRDRVMAHAADCAIPALLLYGGADKVISTAMAQQWFSRLRCEKRCVVFPDCYHELHNESVFADVLRETAEWILKK